MKSKLLYLGTALLALLLCAGLYAASAGDGTRRVHQHLASAGGAESTEPAAAEEFCTHLPILSIETGGYTMPGAPITENGVRIGYTTAWNGAERLRVAFSLIDGGTGENRLTDAPAATAQAEVRYRGNSSRFFDKKSYSVHFVTDDGAENPIALLGMAAHDEWALNGPFLDRTLLRNYLCLNIAGEIMEYAPNVRYCELFLDGEYQGVYLLMETVSRGEGRLELPLPVGRSDATGYIVRWDRAAKGDRVLNNYAYYTLRSDISALDVRYPGATHMTEGRLAYIESDISRIERTLYSAAVSSEQGGAQEYLDYNAFADYFILNEFFRNVDAGQFSTYYYKDPRGKLKPCVWDFNNACGNYIDYPWGAEGFSMPTALWFEALVKDERFVTLVVEKYRRLRRGVLAEDYLIEYVDETLAWLGDAAARNFEIWGYAFDLSHYDGVNYLIPVERNATSHEEAVAQLKEFLISRGAWMDEHIESLYQYCHDSKNAGERNG